MLENSSEMDEIEQHRRVHALIEPTVLEIIRSLHLPLGSSGLDAGCGIGLPALLLADEVGPTGKVTGLDQSEELIREAEQVVKQADLSDQVVFQRGDVQQLPFEDNTFEWAWSASCVGYAPSIDPWYSVRELARVVNPGGTVALLAFSSEKLLPGYPLLEARLNATASGRAPFVSEGKPEMHFMRALGWFKAARLRNVAAQSFVGDLQAPLKQQTRQALIALFTMRWQNMENELPEELYKVYQKICLPQSPDFIGDHPDYYAFFTFTLFTGYV